MASKDEMIEARRQQLLKKKYPPPIVELALSWADNSAEGMTKYALQGGDDNHFDEIKTGFLHRYLNDCEKWIKSMIT